MRLKLAGLTGEEVAELSGAKKTRKIRAELRDHRAQKIRELHRRLTPFLSASFWRCCSPRHRPSSARPRACARWSSGRLARLGAHHQRPARAGRDGRAGVRAGRRCAPPPAPTVGAAGRARRGGAQRHDRGAALGRARLPLHARARPARPHDALTAARRAELHLRVGRRWSAPAWGGRQRRPRAPLHRRRAAGRGGARPSPTTCGRARRRPGARLRRGR